MSQPEPCADCKELTGKPCNTEPHGNLSLKQKKRIMFSGYRAYDAAYYKCINCGCILIREMDTNDFHSVWSRHK